jgi:hypothetical protein
MILRILNRQNFVQKFLIPLSRVNDLCTLTLDPNICSNLNRTPDNNFSLYSFTDDIEFDGDKHNISFADIKKFIKVLECIPDEQINLHINSNNIEYKSNGTKFKFHLINDNIVKSPNFNLEKMNALEFDISFKLTSIMHNLLIKSSTFITDSNKIYLNTDNEGVMAELTDKTKVNIDSYSKIISESFIGNKMEKPLAFNFDLFRNISFLKTNEIEVKLNTTRGFIAFIVKDDKYNLKYISTAHVS